MFLLRIIKKFNNEIDFIPGKKVSGAPKLINYKRSHSTTRILICLYSACSTQKNIIRLPFFHLIFQYLICNKWSNFAQITQSRIRTIHSLVVLSAQEPLQEFYLLLLVQIQVNGLDKLSLHTLFGHRWLPCFLDLSITQVIFN